MNRKRVPCRFFLLFLAVLCVGLALGRGDRQTTPRETTLDDNAQIQAEAIKQQLISRIGINFQTSLDMKENVDFLLTPALLAQESICGDIIITYPSE